jgi:hypothetical protein
MNNFLLEAIMHNLISFNQLAYWHTVEKNIMDNSDDLIADYFECLTECDEDAQSCKRVCRSILSHT